jgi:hypothetical protein
VSAPAFTPGPWQSKHDYTKEGACTIVGNVDGEIHSDGTTTHSYDFICTCEDEYGEYIERAEANARLIAAAPELYEATQVAMTAIRPLVDQGEDRIWRAAAKAMDALSAAASKARGEQ